VLFDDRSDNFDQLQLSTYPKDGRFDPESVRVAKNGKSVFISYEYGPFSSLCFTCSTSQNA
jgi:hypothetical protein